MFYLNFQMSFEDPLIQKLPISTDSSKSISELLNFLGYEVQYFNEILKSLLIEELLDRLTPKPEEIERLKLQPNHIEMLQKDIEQKTKSKWDVLLVYEFWNRIKHLDTSFNRQEIPFHRKLQILATREHKCEICGKEPPHKLHIDHIYAASKGGSNDLWNLRILCSDCNIKKSNHFDWRIKL